MAANFTQNMKSSTRKAITMYCAEENDKKNLSTRFNFQIKVIKTLFGNFPRLNLLHSVDIAIFMVLKFQNFAS